eukprot:scaffold3549_cov110-Skeletonema_dohrnii-CCMP3373.AAC.5
MGSLEFTLGVRTLPMLILREGVGSSLIFGGGYNTIINIEGTLRSSDLQQQRTIEINNKNMI